MIDILKYEFIRTKRPYIVLAIILILIEVVAIITGMVDKEYFNLLAFNIIAIIAFIVINTFSYNKSVLNVNLYYSLPIARKTLVLGKLAYSVISYIVLYLVTSLVTGLFISLYEGSFEVFSSIFIGVGLMYFIFGLSILGLYSLLYGMAKRIIDGIIYIVLFEVFMSLAMNSIIQSTDMLFATRYSFNTFSVSAITNLFETNNIYNSPSAMSLFVFYFFLILGFLAYIASYFLLLYDKGENSNRVDSRAWTYNIFLPAIIILSGYLIGINNSNFTLAIIYISLLIVVEYVVFVLLNRTVKINKNSLIGLITSSVVAFLLVLLVLLA